QEPDQRAQPVTQPAPTALGEHRTRTRDHGQAGEHPEPDPAGHRGRERQRRGDEERAGDDEQIVKHKPWSELHDEHLLDATVSCSVSFCLCFRRVGEALGRVSAAARRASIPDWEATSYNRMTRPVMPALRVSSVALNDGYVI